MKTSLTLVGLALTLAACAAPETGIRDAAHFVARAERTEVASARPSAEVARCFSETAALLPFSTILPDPDGAGLTYRLRGYGYTFEEIRFRDGVPAGSVATVLLAPGVNDRWRRDLERDRLAPLRACSN